MRGQGRGGRGSVEASGKRHVAGPREGETREEEVGNLDPGMNDPLPLGARGVPLSRRPSPPSATLARASSTLYSSRRGDDSAGIRSPLYPPPSSPPPPPVTPLFTPSLLGAHHPLLPSVPRPLTIVIPLPSYSSFPRSSALSLSDSRRRSLSHSRFHSRRTLALHANLSRGG